MDSVTTLLEYKISHCLETKGLRELAEMAEMAPSLAYLLRLVGILEPSDLCDFCLSLLFHTLESWFTH